MITDVSPFQHMKNTLAKMNEEFKAALPPQIPVDKFIRTTITAIQMAPELLQADRKSLLGSCMRAAQDGLLCDGREAALVIFRGKDGPRVQYMPMVGGILKKIRNSGELASISAHVVYDRDKFEYELGDNEQIIHKPHLGDERGQQIACYAIAKTKDGAIYREVMSVGDVEKVRAASRAGKYGPWVDWWDEMAKKTVIRRLSKRLPSSADLDSLIKADDEAQGFATIDRHATVNVTPQGGSNSTPMSRLKAAIETSMEGEQNDVHDSKGTLREVENLQSDSTQVEG